MSLSIYVNYGSVDDEYGTSGTSFVQFSSGNDKIYFSAGSAQVINGGDTPSESELISAGVQLDNVVLPYTLENYYMLDAGSNLIREIPLMGDGNYRYVLAFSFDATTASEPVLECWDDSNLNTVAGTILGGGTPSNSFIRGVVTTAGSPGSSWTGTPLAGSGSGNYLQLNNGSGALSGADVLYANLKVVIPASQTTGFSAFPVFVCKYLSA
jgi:hypothetical protein